MANPQKHIVLITTGQPSSNPRLVKEADALSAKGYKVSVFYAYWARWADLNDEAMLKDKKWKGILCGGHPEKKILRWYFTRLRQKLAKNLPRLLGLHRLFCRSYDELLFRVLKSNADLYIAHNLGALAVAAEASKKKQKPFAFDAEDFHSGERPTGHPLIQQVRQLEEKYLPGALYVSAASPLIAQAYEKQYKLPNSVKVTNNVFPLALQPIFNIRKPGNPLRLFWFSQTLGRDRGIEDILLATAQLQDIPIEIGLLGNYTEEDRIYFLSFLLTPSHQLAFLPLRSERELIQLSATYDIGLALERDQPMNRNLCLTNKLFTYLLAGNAILASETLAQRDFMRAYPQVGQSYPIGDAHVVANILRYYWEYPEILEKERRAAWQLAKEELNWDKEQNNFLERVKSAL